MQLKTLRKKIDSIRSQRPGKRVHFPDSVWKHVAQLSESTPLRTLAQELGLNEQNLSRQIKKRKGTSPPSKKDQFLEVPSQLLKLDKKQLSIELPHGITLRIDL